MKTDNNMKGFNIAEALKYAPKGLKLYTPLFGEVRFIKVFQDTILANTLRDIDATFFQDGRYYNYNNTECLLFPSVNHRCWNNWQNTLFLESIGSVCVDTITGNKFILGEDGTYFSDNTGNSFHFLIDDEDSGNYLLNSRYASPEEAKEFFEELEKNGYKWDGKMVVKSTSQPKFKVGDWVVQENIGVYKVIEVCESWYEVVDNQDKHYSIGFDKEYMCHLWSIQDAKDGDVLYSLDSKQPFIFKHRKPNEQAVVYCGINTYGKFFIGNTKDCVITTDKYIPADKFQRELLFKKMQKAGYQWNPDKKKLKKINTLQPNFQEGDWVVNNNSGDVFQVTEIKDDEYCLWPLYGEICGYLRFIDVDTDYHLWTIVDAKDGDVLTNDNNSIFIFKEEYIAGKPTAYCGIIDGDFFAKTSGCWTNEKCYPATKEQTDFLFQKIKEKGYKWDVDAKKLIKTTIPIPKFRIGDIIKHKPTGQINTIKYVCSDYYILDNNNALFFESQDMWELAASKANPSLEDKVSILADEIIALKQRVKALEIQVIKDMSTPPLTKDPYKDPYLNPNKVTCDYADGESKTGLQVYKTPDKAGDNVTLEEMRNECKG